MRLIWILALAACRDDEKPGNDGDVTPGESTLALVVPADAVRAGEPAPYTATVTSDDGSSEEVEPVLRSDLETGIVYDATTITPTVVGTHTIQATWEDLDASATLQVIAGPAATVDLVLAADTVASGEPVAYEVHATDAWGNPVDGSGAAIIASSTNVTVGAGTVSATETGTYDVTAILDGQSDVESFTVTAGPGAVIDLVLTPKALEVGDTASAEVTITDASGNDASDPYTLDVTGVAATVAGNVITFQGEGWFTVTATIDGTSLSDSVGPILIDSTGPDIDLVEPPRAEWAFAWLGDDGTASGTITDAWSDVVSAERNGEPLALEPDGSFSVDDDDAYDWGMTVTETTATDSDGNVSTDRRSTLLGYFLDADDSAWSGIRVRLDDGPGGLDVLEDLGAGLVPAGALGDAIVNPVFEDSTLLYSVSLDVTNPTFSSSSLDLDCTTEGIETTFTIFDAALDYDATGTVVAVPYSTDGTITMDSIEVTLLAVPTVSGGAIQTEVSDLDVSIRGFDFPMANWLEDVLDFFGVDIDEIVQGYVEDGLRESLEDEFPSLLDDALAGFEMAETLPVLGVDFAFEAVPNSVLLDDDGLTILLETTFDGGPLTTPHPTSGSLLGSSWDDPEWPATGAAFGLGADFVNQILHGVWGHELLYVEAPLAEFGIDPAALAVILPGVKDPIFVLDPILPPVVAPIPVTGGAGQFTFQMGDARLSIYDGTVDDAHLALDAYLAVQADLSIEVGSDLTLIPTFGATTFWVDVVAPRLGEEANEGLLGAMAPLFLPSLTEFLGAIPLPSLAGFALEDVSVTTSEDGGYAVLGGELVAE
jgi:hypothetical protein